MELTLNPGHTRGGRAVTWSGADNPHLYISGQSGTGKSYLLKKLARQAAEQGNLVLVLDYTSDFQDYMPPEGLAFQHFDVTSADFGINPLIGLPGQSPDARAQVLLAALHSVFRMGVRASVALRRATAEYLETAQTPTLDGLLTHISGLKETSAGLISAMEPLALFSSLVNCGNQPISLDLNKPGLTVLDFSNIFDRDICKLLVELTLQVLWTFRTAQHPPLILVLDEAQQLNWGDGSIAIRILREGRKFEIGGWFSSQWMDKNEALSALGQAACQVHFRPDVHNVGKVAKTICSGSKNLDECRKALQGLKRGQFIWRRGDRPPVIVNVDA